MEYPFTIYFWRVKDPVTGRTYRTRHRMTEEEARQRHPEGAEREEYGAMVIKGPATQNEYPKPAPKSK